MFVLSGRGCVEENHAARGRDAQAISLWNTLPIRILTLYNDDIASVLDCTAVSHLDFEHASDLAKGA